MVKRGKVGPRGGKVLRFILNMTASNMIQTAIAGDVEQMCNATKLLSFVLLGSEILILYGEDLVACFNLLEVPDEWLPFFVLAKPVPRSIVGLDGVGYTYLAVASLPQGWPEKQWS